jgi:hypothetical protein
MFRKEVAAILIATLSSKPNDIVFMTDLMSGGKSTIVKACYDAINQHDIPASVEQNDMYVAVRLKEEWDGSHLTVMGFTELPERVQSLQQTQPRYGARPDQISTASELFQQAGELHHAPDDDDNDQTIQTERVIVLTCPKTGDTMTILGKQDRNAFHDLIDKLLDNDTDPLTIRIRKYSA